MDWYVTRNGEIHGPFSIDVLVKGVWDGKLVCTDFVWSIGMPGWQAAQNVPRLWAPPSPPQTSTVSPRVTAPAEEVAKANLVRNEPKGSGRIPDARTAPFKNVGLVPRHWRGDLTLPQSYWGVGLIVTICVIGVGQAFVWFVPRLGLSAAAFSSALGLCALLCMCTVWALVGLWRSAGGHRQTAGRRLWGTLAQVTVVLEAASAVIAIYTVIGPMLLESGRLAARLDNTPPHRLRLLRDGTELELAGGMPFGTADALEKLLDASPGVQVVHLNSMGGRVVEGYKIHQIIRNRELIAYTASNCMSACTIAFLGGTQRLLSTHAKLGFHSISFGGVDQKHIPEINAGLRRTLSLHGASEWFINKALSTGAESTWYPTRAELMSAKIVTGIVDPDQFGLSGISNWHDQEAIEKELLSIPLYALVRDNDPDAFKKFSDLFSKGVKLGKSVPEMTRELQETFFSEIIPKYMQTAPDEVVRRYWQTQLAEMEYLMKTNPEQCVAFLLPDMRSDGFNLKRLVPDVLLKEDVAALTALVEQAITNPHNGKTVDLEDEVAEAISRISVTNPRAQELLTDPMKYTDEPEILCSAFISFYADVMALPTEQSAAILRATSEAGR